jgi:hypothetical protein
MPFLIAKLFIFLALPITTEAMGIGDHRYTGCSICGRIRCRGTAKGNAGAKSAECTARPALAGSDSRWAGVCSVF